VANVAISEERAAAERELAALKHKVRELVSWLEERESAYRVSEGADHEDEWHEGYAGGAGNMCSYTKLWIDQNVNLESST
jgi:hypothetical protein